MFNKIIDFLCKLGISTKEKNTIEETTIYETNPIIKDPTYYFKVAGISFHYKELDKIIKSLLDEGMIEKFDGNTNKDIIEYGEGMTIFEHQYIKGVKLEPYIYEGKDAIRILLPDYKNNWYDVGNVPKRDLKQVIEILNNKTITNGEFTITGGKAKYINYDEYNNDKPYIVEREYDYGVEICLTYKDN